MKFIVAPLLLIGSIAFACEDHAHHAKKEEGTTSASSSGVVLASAATTAKPTTTSKAADKAVDDVTAEPTAEESAKAKEDFQKKMETELAEIEKEIDELAVKAKSATDDAGKSAKAKIKELNVRKAKVQASLKKAARTSGRTWAKVKTGVEKAMDDLKSAYNEAKDEFNKGMAEDEGSETK